MSAFTAFHVVLSLIGIVAGFVVVVGFLASQPGKLWTVLFLVTTVATSVTGFFFPFHGFTPALGVGVVSLAVLTVTLYALYGRGLAGAWRWIYTVTAVFALYLNFFVLIVQAFQKVPALKALAPTQAEPPFVIAQSVALVVFVVLGILSILRFRSVPASIA